MRVCETNVCVSLQWTPFGFRMQILDSMYEISKERFEGTVLRAISKHPRKELLKNKGGAGDLQVSVQQVKSLCSRQNVYIFMKLLNNRAPGASCINSVYALFHLLVEMSQNEPTLDLP